MKPILSIILLFIANTAASETYSDPAPVLFGVFDGRTPCQEIGMQLTKDLPDACTKIKWRLILYKDTLTQQPATFELTGFLRQLRAPLAGTWKIIKGTADDPNAMVYRLEATNGSTLLLLSVDDTVLFFLDQERKPLVGNGDFSYTLNRVG